MRHGSTGVLRVAPNQFGATALGMSEIYTRDISSGSMPDTYITYTPRKAPQASRRGIKAEEENNHGAELFWGLRRYHILY